MSKIFLSDPVNSAMRMHECGSDGYWFYHKESFPSDPPMKYSDILQNATTHIDIWDPYFNLQAAKADQFIFATVPTDITLRILTQKGIDSTSNFLTDMHNALKIVVPPSRNLTFAIRVMNKIDMTLREWRMHDRILVIDRTDVYLIGSSLGYHLYPEMSTGIYKVEKQDTADFIISILQKYWDKAQGNEIPYQSLHLAI